MDDRWRAPQSDVALLTGGGDRPYAHGLASSLIARGIRFDFIGSDFLESPQLRQSPYVRFLNLRGDMEPTASLLRKVGRLLAYYGRLIRYAATAEVPIFHILWNNKIEIFDRTLLLYFYRLVGKRLVLTVHNVNAADRDGKDSGLNRYTLRKQYNLVDHLFVHTRKMKNELCSDYGVRPEKIILIPFGLNDSVPNTELSPEAARQRLGFDGSHKTVLFFGNIAPYKGLEYLVEAMAALRETVPEARLIIVGRPKGEQAYWHDIERRIEAAKLADAIYKRIEYVGDEEIEVFFKAADVLVLPYTTICQSGVLFLGYNFGVPVVATDVGDLKEYVRSGATGLTCAPRQGQQLGQALQDFFNSSMYRDQVSTRRAIEQFARENCSWEDVAARTVGVYRSVLGPGMWERSGRAPAE